MGIELKQLAWVLAIVPFLACCGGKSDRNAAGSEEQPEERPGELVAECSEENSEAECKLYCHLESGEPVGGGCFPVAPGGPYICSCDWGPSEGRYFPLESCADLEASIQSVCAQTSPLPDCPSVPPPPGEQCSHRQSCWIEDFVGDCSPGEAVRSTAVGVNCVDGFWQQAGTAEAFCP